MYCLFEGVDTCGKTTQIELLRQSFPDAVITKEPGGTPLGRTLRSLILHEGVRSYRSELFLFLADRAEHYQEVIAPNKEKLILSDRGFVSGIAYALANHPDLKIDFLIEQNLFALEGTLPDRIFLFKTTASLIAERLESKSEDRIERRGIDYLLRVQELMETVVQKMALPYLMIDASESIETIHQHIIKGLHP